MPVHHRVVQERLHELGGRRADLGRQRTAGGAGPQDAGDLLGGQMVGMGQALAWPLGAGMGGHQRVVAGIEPDLLTAAADPEGCPMRRKGAE